MLSYLGKGRYSLFTCLRQRRKLDVSAASRTDFGISSYRGLAETELDLESWVVLPSASAVCEEPRITINRCASAAACVQREVLVSASTSPSERQGISHRTPCSCQSLEEMMAEENAEEIPSQELLMCVRHGQPLTFQCKQCDLKICEECLLEGEHDHHQPVLFVDDQADKRREAIAESIAKLKADVPAHLRGLLGADSDIDERFEAKLDDARRKISAAGKLALKAVEKYVQQKLREVDEFKERRCRDRQLQREEIERRLKDVKETADDGDGILEQDMKSGRACSLYLRLEKRVSVLDDARLGEKHVCSPSIIFQPISEEQMQAKVGEVVGSLYPCHACARQSSVAGVPGPVRRVTKGQRVSFLLQTRNSRGEPLQSGGDLVATQWKKVPVTNSALLPVQVQDKEDGKYVISYAAQEEGEYLLEVTVNDESMLHAIPLSCHCQWSFDPTSCSKGITLSRDGRTATHSGERCWGSVLGSHRMTSGLFSWSVKIGCTKQVDNFIGVAIKESLTQAEGNYRETYSWTNDGRQWMKGESLLCMGQWEDGDTLSLELNCEERELQITNLRSGESSTISELPGGEVVPYFSMYYRESSMVFVNVD